MQRRVELRVRLLLDGLRTVRRRFISHQQHGRLPLRRRKDVRHISPRGIRVNRRSTAPSRILLRKTVPRRWHIRVRRCSRGRHRNIGPRRRGILFRRAAMSSRNIILLRNLVSSSRNPVQLRSRNIIRHRSRGLSNRNPVPLRSRNIIRHRSRGLSSRSITRRLSRGPSRKFIRLRLRTLNRVPRLKPGPGTRIIANA